MDWAKNRAIREAKMAGQGNTGKKGASWEPVIALGMVAWDNMFTNGTIKLP